MNTIAGLSFLNRHNLADESMQLPLTFSNKHATYI